MKNKYRFLKIIFTVGILIFLLNFSLKRFSNKPVDNIYVKMIQEEPVGFIDEKYVQNVIFQLTPSKKIGDLQISAIERKLAENPAVDSVNVFLKLNGELNLHIVQRIPIFRLSKKGKSFYVDEQGAEIPTTRDYSYPCMLVSGNVEKEEYPLLVELIRKINGDSFSKNFFVGISKVGRNYYLATNQGDYRVEFGSLENIDFKIQGFKTFVEKYLIYQDQKKYSNISLKYDNQIVTTLRDRKDGSEQKDRIYKPEEKKEEIETKKEVQPVQNKKEEQKQEKTTEKPKKPEPEKKPQVKETKK